MHKGITQTFPSALKAVSPLNRVTIAVGALIFWFITCTDAAADPDEHAVKIQV